MKLQTFSTGMIAILSPMILWAAAPAGAAPDQVAHVGWTDGLFFLVLIGLFYFMLIRPQSKRAKTHRDMISSLNKGDEVITTGGLIGKISKLGEQFVSVSLNEQTEIKIQKQAISQVLPKGTLKSLN